MLYELFYYLETQYQISGASLFQFISFRSAFAVIISLIVSTIFGKKIIDFLKKKQVGENIRDLGLNGQKEKHLIHLTHHLIWMKEKKKGPQQWKKLALM